MNVLGIIDYIHQVQQQATLSLERRLGAAALVGFAGLFILVAGIFVAAASYLWFETMMAAHLAALCVAGEFLLVALVILAFARAKKSNAEMTVAPDPSARLAEEMESAAHRVVTHTVTQIRQNPSSAVIGALVAGFVLGIVRRDD